MDSIIENLKVYFDKNPKYIWYLMGIVFIFVGISSILGKEWAAIPANSRQHGWQNLLGEKLFSRILGVILTLSGIFAIIVGVFWVDNS